MYVRCKQQWYAREHQVYGISPRSRGPREILQPYGPVYITTVKYLTLSTYNQRLISHTTVFNHHILAAEYDFYLKHENKPVSNLNISLAKWERNVLSLTSIPSERVIKPEQGFTLGSSCKLRYTICIYILHCEESSYRIIKYVAVSMVLLCVLSFVGF